MERHKLSESSPGMDGRIRNHGHNASGNAVMLCSHWDSEVHTNDVEMLERFV